MLRKVEVVYVRDVYQKFQLLALLLNCVTTHVRSLINPRYCHYCGVKYSTKPKLMFFKKLFIQRDGTRVIFSHFKQS